MTIDVMMCVKLPGIRIMPQQVKSFCLIMAQSYMFIKLDK
jgi:hypothetical protein